MLQRIASLALILPGALAFGPALGAEVSREMLRKAARVRPTPRQAAWQELEFTCFAHFGVNTFNEVEWGSGREAPSLFNPTELDANQWLDAIKNFGGKMIVLVSKHHDGFCLWPTRYTPHSVASSPWRGAGPTRSESSSSSTEPTR